MVTNIDDTLPNGYSNDPTVYTSWPVTTRALALTGFLVYLVDFLVSFLLVGTRHLIPGCGINDNVSVLVSERVSAAASYTLPALFDTSAYSKQSAVRVVITPYFV